MKRFTAILALSIGAILFPTLTVADDKDDGWVSLFDGETLKGWEANEKPECFKAGGGILTVEGGMAHLFYVGPVRKHDFKDFEFRCEVKTFPHANSGIFFHTENRGRGLVRKGYEAQINNSYAADPRKTGSLVIIDDRKESPVKDNDWFDYHIIVKGKQIVLKVNGKTIVDYTEPAEPKRPKGRELRVLSSGTFAIQAHDAKSKTLFRKIRVKPLD
ncbi:MAG: DUF1080 domain-containing protein [Planctomycetes bacterium]|nr:DUF1080 domain-containing protein [Planctomycetota bacterium]